MNKITIPAATLMLVISFSANANAQAEAAAGVDVGPGAPKVLVVGAFFELGMAHLVGDNNPFGIDDAKPRFSGSFGAYIDWYIVPMLAIEAGLDITGKGARWEDGDIEAREKFQALEVPIGAKLNVMNIQASLLINFSFGLVGKTEYDFDGFSGDVDWTDENEFIEGDNDTVWDNRRRFNFGPKIVVGYAIPLGVIPLSVVPAISWSIHLLNEYRDMPDDFDDSIRAMNFMFRVGAEFGL